ncbi:MAG: SulP family inorganic anion transporter [Planctomycetota bacterium]
MNASAPPVSNASNLRGDLFGGLTAGIVALPLALAFGEQTELGAIAGLYGAIVVGLLAAIFGGTKTQISGPTAPMTVVAALVITDAIELAGGLEPALPMIVATFLLAGALQVVMGLLGLGRYIRYIPQPVVSGFMSGIGVIIIITQLFPLLGADAPAGGPLGTIRNLHTVSEVLNGTSVAIAAATMAIIYLLPRLTKAVPSSLVALVAVTSLAHFLVAAGDVPRINSDGPIPTGLPDLELGFLAVFGSFEQIVAVMQYALTLAALGAIDSLLTSVVADNLTATRHNSNRELVGQGLGNAAAALIAGLPGAGATMRTVINIKSGGRTQVSGVVAGLLLMAVLLGLGTLVGHVPNAVLAGILVTVGIGIIDYRGFRRLFTVPRADATVMVTVLFLTVFVDLLTAVAVGMVLASLLFMKVVADVVEERLESAPLHELAREVPWADESDLLAREGHRIYIKHLDGPLFFGFASRFQEILQSLSELELVVMRMDRVPYIDQSGLMALEEAIQRLKEQDLECVFVGIEGQPRDMCERVELIPSLVPESRCFDTFADFTQWVEGYLRDAPWRDRERVAASDGA